MHAAILIPSARQHRFREKSIGALQQSKPVRTTDRWSEDAVAEQEPHSNHDSHPDGLLQALGLHQALPPALSLLEIHRRNCMSTLKRTGSSRTALLAGSFMQISSVDMQAMQTYCL